MMRTLAAIVGVVVMAWAAGCVVSTESEDVARGEAELDGLEAGGCRLECPECKSGDPCPLRPCVMECSQGHHKCGDNVCGKGEYCCNESCGICAPEGGSCTQQLCYPAGETCGDNTCAPNEHCCNESCGICAPEGGSCTQQICAPAGVVCGDAVCPDGQLCCNESCGICTAPGEVCTQQICF
jgi:hypothetical protein